MMNMTLTEKQLKILPKLKTELAYSKVEHLLSVYYENQLKKEVSQIFSETRYEVIRNLTEYYDSDVMFQAHMDLILAPIHEVHKKYYETLLKYKIREFDKSRDAGKRIVERTINFRREGNVINKQFTVLKADINDMVSSTISKDKLFGTSEIAHNNLASRTYTLSEKTLSRVDTNINDIITKGYDEGWGVNKVAHEVNTRFNQLETWESSRIARTEIHNSHSLGLIQGYDDMGVEYIQWSAANDNRTRDTHISLDGEIIPLGGVFSNGLMYPGDMLGSAEEVINCRCQALPYIIPYGFIAPPDMAQFREDDLIATLDYFNADELVQQAMMESSQISVIDENNKLIKKLSKFSFTEQDTLRYNELQLLKSEKKLKGFKNRKELELLENQKKLDSLHQKFIKNGKLSSKEADSYKKIYNNLKIQKKFKLDLLEDTLKLEGKTKTNIFENIPKREKSKYDKKLDTLRKTKHSTINNTKYINRTHDSQEAIDEMVEIQKLTGYKKELAITWSGDANVSMNDYLKGGEIDLRYGDFSSVNELKETTDELIDLIDNIPTENCIQEDTLFFRGTPDDRIDFDMFIPDGKTRKLKTLTSSSYDVDVADNFAGYTDKDGAQGWILKIHAPKGTKGVAINGELGNAGEEHEYLLSPNQKYITHNVDKENKIIEIELVI